MTKRPELPADSAGASPEDDALRQLMTEHLPAHRPAPDFADRVLARVESARLDSTRLESARDRQSDSPRLGTKRPVPLEVPRWRAAPSRSIRWRPWAVGGTVALAAAMTLVLGQPSPASGSLSADMRTERALGPHTLAVAEPGSRIAWNGTQIRQDTGDVFYRVDKGTPVVVETPFGTVRVHGTCFRVQLEEETNMHPSSKKGLLGGLAAGALLTVLVYEGKVALSAPRGTSGGEEASLVAGQTGRVRPGAISVEDSVSEDAHNAAPRGPSTAASPSSADGPVAMAAHLAEMRSRLAAVEKERADLLERLVEADARSRNSSREDVDKTVLSKEDWSRMAKEGTFQFSLPCEQFEAPSPEELQSMGLAPTDVEALERANSRANDRIWQEIRPLCAEVLGSEAQADKMRALCPDLIGRKTDRAAAAAAGRAVAEMRAGERPLPAPGERVSPIMGALLISTSAWGWFEEELAKEFGPAEAHRLATSKGLCRQTSRYHSKK